MKTDDDALHRMLSEKLSQSGIDILDLIPIPRNSNQMVKIRTLEELLRDFDSDADGETYSFLIQCKRPSREMASPPPFSAKTAPVQIQIEKKEEDVRRMTPSQLDGIYKSDGKINVLYLQENAKILLSAREYALARNIYSTILRSGEKTAEALLGIGICFEKEGKKSESEKFYEDSIAFSPSLDAIQRLASLLIRSGRNQYAAEILERGFFLDDISVKDKFELSKAAGNSWFKGAHFEKAEKHYKKALQLDPGAADIRSNLGTIHLERKELEEARRCFQDAVAADPQNEKAHYGLGISFYEAGDLAQAHRSFVQSLDLNLNQPSAIFYLVKSAYPLKEYRDASRILEEYVQIAPVNVNLLYSLAGLQFHMGRMDESLKTCRRILEMKSDHRGASDLIRLIERKNNSNSF
jgi:tetratricopeptide (TPR) repeat protein